MAPVVVARPSTPRNPRMQALYARQATAGAIRTDGGSVPYWFDADPHQPKVTPQWRVAQGGIFVAHAKYQERKEQAEAVFPPLVFPCGYVFGELPPVAFEDFLLTRDEKRAATAEKRAAQQALKAPGTPFAPSTPLGGLALIAELKKAVLPASEMLLKRFAAQAAVASRDAANTQKAVRDAQKAVRDGNLATQAVVRSENGATKVLVSKSISAAEATLAATLQTQTDLEQDRRAAQKLRLEQAAAADAENEQRKKEKREQEKADRAKADAEREEADRLEDERDAVARALRRQELAAQQQREVAEAVQAAEAAVQAGKEEATHEFRASVLHALQREPAAAPAEEAPFTLNRLKPPVGFFSPVVVGSRVGATSTACTPSVCQLTHAPPPTCAALDPHLPRMAGPSARRPLA